LRTLMTAAVAALCAAASIVVSAPAALAAPAATACTGTVQITSLTFNPTHVAPGQSATATVVARNCTDQPLQASVLFLARFVGPSTGIPAGCPVIDPLPPRQVSFAAGGRYRTSVGYLVFAGCTATSLAVTARFTDASGAVLATRTASLPITAAAGAATDR
jgi:hypothetical protein